MKTLLTLIRRWRTRRIVRATEADYHARAGWRRFGEAPSERGYWR